MCKVNFVAFVKEFLPLSQLSIKTMPFIFSTLFKNYHHFFNEIFHSFIKIGIINLTYVFLLWEINYYADQTKAFASKELPTLTSRYGSRFLISNARFFRCTRLASSQIRDVKTCSLRFLDDYQSYSNLWIFSSFFLSGANCLRGRGACWVTPSQTGAPDCTQAFPRNHELCSRAANAQSSSSPICYCRKNPKSIWAFNSPTQHRAGLIKGSKKNLSVKEIVTKSSQKKSVSDYEELREKVLQQRPADIGLFLQRGFVEWLIFNEENKHTPINMSHQNYIPYSVPKADIISILTTIMFHHQKGDRHDNIRASF